MRLKGKGKIRFGVQSKFLDDARNSTPLDYDAGQRGWRPTDAELVIAIPEIIAAPNLPHDA